MNIKNIRPFSDFWINCDFNYCFSILTSIEETYREYACMNSYSYEINEITTPRGTIVKYIGLESTDTEQLRFASSKIKKIAITFKDKANLIDDIIYLLKNHILLVGVDLFEWIPKSICWKKYHWEHYSLIVDYYDERKTFAVLDENLSGYGMHEVPIERFTSAVLNSSLKEDGYILRCDGGLERFEFDSKVVFENALSLKDGLEGMANENKLWGLSSQDIAEGHMFDLFSMYAYQISNRHVANMKMMNMLLQHSCISKASCELLTQRFFKIKRGWEIVKNRFIRGIESNPHCLDIEYLNELKTQFISEEISTWDALTKLME